MIIPSRTITAPTRGFGALPSGRHFWASAIARLMNWSFEVASVTLGVAGAPSGGIESHPSESAGALVSKAYQSHRDCSDMSRKSPPACNEVQGHFRPWTWTALAKDLACNL